MLVKLVLAGFLAALALPALILPAAAQCVEETASTSTSTPVATTDKPAPVSKPAGG